MTPLTTEKIAELKSNHKELIAIEANGQALVFRKPKRLEFDQWFDKRSETAAGLSLAKQCLVFPTGEEFMAVLEDRPGILMCSKGIVDSITDMAGMDGGASAKKL